MTLDERFEDELDVERELYRVLHECWVVYRMVQIKSDRLSDRYCPKCGERLQYWGRIYYKDKEQDIKDDSKNMLLCIVEECNNCVPYEEGLEFYLTDPYDW